MSAPEHTDAELSRIATAGIVTGSMQATNTVSAPQVDGAPGSPSEAVRPEDIRTPMLTATDYNGRHLDQGTTDD